MLWRKLAVGLMVLGVGVSATPAFAAPARVFTPYLDAIRQNLPPGYAMRLPSEILLGGTADEAFIRQLIVRVFSSTIPPGLTVSLFTCKTGNQPCFVGSFAVDNQNSANAIEELRKHKALGKLVTLSRGIQGFFLEGLKQNPSYPFSSIMWKQERMIYTVKFLAEERQNILNMAHSMANEKPIRRTDVTFR